MASIINVFMMRFLTVLLLISFVTPVLAKTKRHPANHQGEIPEDPGIVSKVEGYMGGGYRCQAPTVQELQGVDDMIKYMQIDGRPSDVAKFGKRMVENYLEELFFQEMAFRSHNTNKCQLSFLNTYATNSSWANAMNEHAWKVYALFHPVLNRMLLQRGGTVAFSQTIMEGHDPMDHSEAQFNQDLKAAKLNEEAASLDAGINAIIAQVPMGNHKNVRVALRNLALQNNVSESDFVQAYSNSLRVLRPKIQKAEQYFSSLLDKNGFYKLSRSDKITYVQSGQADGLLKQLDPSETKLACRVKAMYSKGPENTQLLLNIGLSVASLATDGAAAFLIGLGMTASTIAEVVHQCFQPTTNVSGSTQVCDPAHMADSALSEASMISCGVNAMFATVQALGPYALEIRKAYKSLRSLEATAAAEEVAAAERAAAQATRVAREAKAAVPEATTVQEIVVTASRKKLPVRSAPVEPVPGVSAPHSEVSPPLSPAPRTYSHPELSVVATEVDPYLKTLPKNIQTRLEAKFASQTEDQTLKDMKDIRDHLRIQGGSCR